jgi:hypothetical protein
MQTYGSFISSQAYRPHLDSTDFNRFLRVSVIIALILGMAFSIRGNFKGLMQTLERDMFWLFIIAIAITVTSSLLSMISVVKINGLKIVSRVLIGCVAIGLFYISTRLTFIGFVTGEKTQLVSAIQENPELLDAKKELENIVNRQGEYGLSQSEKLSLLAREREQRAFITELTKRLIIENRNAKSNLENAIGNEKRIAMTLFALGPELCIAVLSPLVVLLFGAGCGVLRDEKQIENNEPEQKERIIYVQVPADQISETSGDNGVQKTGIQHKPELSISQKELNDKVITQLQGNSRAIINEQWNPFK